MAANGKELLAENLRTLLDQRGWSQAELARELGISAPQVSKWLAKTSFPRIDQLDAMADLFDVPLLRFFADPNNEGGGLMSPEEALRVLGEVVKHQRKSKPTN